MKQGCSCLFMVIGAFVGLFGGSLIFSVLNGFGFGTNITGLSIIASLVFFTWIGSKTGNYIGDKIENRKVTHSKPLGKRVALQYVNASGEHRNAYVDSASAFRNHNKVKVNLWDSASKVELVFERIKNPEVLGLSKNPQNEDEVVGRDCPNCSNGNVRAWKGEMRCWNCGHVLKEENILEQHDLESASPPIIEEPIAPVLEEPEAQPVQPKEPVEPKPEPVDTKPEPVDTKPEPVDTKSEPVTTEPATVNVVVTAIGMTSSEATKVLQSARPNLNTFAVYGLLRDLPKVVVENLPRDEAEKIKQELEDAGCTVELK